MTSITLKDIVKAKPDEIVTQDQKSIFLISNYSHQYLASSIQFFLNKSDKNFKVESSDFDQLLFELKNPQSKLNSQQFDFCIIHLSSFVLSSDPHLEPDDYFIGIKTSLEHSAKLYPDRKIVFILPELISDADNIPGFLWAECQKIRQSFIKYMSDLGEILSIDSIMFAQGTQRWGPNKYYEIGKFICSPENFIPIGRYIARSILAATTSAPKLILVDLDNTLWKGIVGDVGWQNVGLDWQGGEYSYIRLQKFLKTQKDAGTLLAIVSKNEEKLAKEVFDNRSEMVLQWEDFVEVRCNWGPKSQSIQSILTGLNLSQKDVYFLDDSHFERAEVKTSCEDIEVLDLPLVHSEWLGHIASYAAFDITFFRKKNIKDRTRLYKDEKLRLQTQSTHTTYHEFLVSLELVIQKKRWDVAIQSRVEELFLRTNQFNLSAIRLEDLTGQNFETEPQIFAYALTDRIGRYGIISALICNFKKETIFIENWVLSCRAFSRGVEEAVLLDLFSDIPNASYLKIRYQETKQNKMVRGYFEGLGMVFNENKSVFECSVSKVSEICKSRFSPPVK